MSGNLRILRIGPRVLRMTSKDKEASESLKLGTSCGPSNLGYLFRTLQASCHGHLLAPAGTSTRYGGTGKRMLVLDDVRALQQAVGVGSGAYRWGPSTNSMSVDLTTDASTPRRDGSAAFRLPYGTSSCTCTTLGVSATLIMAHTVRAQAGDKKS